MATSKKKAPARKAPAKKAPVKKAAPRKAAPKKATGAAAPGKVKPIPDGYHVVTAYLCIDGAGAAIDFYKKAFGATERFRMEAPGGKVGHAEIQIGDSAIMLADEFPEMKFHGPKKGEGTPVNMHLYVPDVDRMMANAIAAGAKVLRAIEDKFYGDRTGSIEDPFGHVWHLATHKEDLSPAEMKRRGEEAAKKGQGG
jgi:PhnB protein